ncbi:ArdC family protein (plasmid) [Ampullimonas aquatilis]|uniref:ArdC family protein n=1 Tax=Ampullimonas aquatilis TaxID=1341549 RepID=UPI003C778598
MNTQSNSNLNTSNHAVVPPAPSDTHKSSDGPKKGFDMKQIVTDKIIALLEKGGNTLSKSWSCGKRGMPINAKTGESYHGVNVFLLWSELIDFEYAQNRWLTFKQAHELGGKVRKGERGVMCCYYNVVNRKQESDSNQLEDGKNTYSLIKPFWLFNLAQIDGLPEEITKKAIGNDFDPNLRADEIIKATQVNILHGFASAYYVPTKDKICLPDPDKFSSSASYYATALHELTHWTGAKSRLNRDFSGRFGDEAYAFEELIADLGAAYLCAETGLIDGTLESHAAYLENWLTILKKDKTAIFTASKQASMAFDYVMQCVNAAHQQAA